MRVLFGCLAVLLAAVSISLAARYGYKGADTMIDGVISAVVFGAIALCAFIFDAAAVRLWFMRHRVGSVVIGAISAAALVVTFTNSLGAIAGRADVTQAERARAKDDVAADRTELARIAGRQLPRPALALLLGSGAAALTVRLQLNLKVLPVADRRLISHRTKQPTVAQTLDIFNTSASQGHANPPQGHG
jgi:hypothetical protein